MATLTEPRRDYAHLRSMYKIPGPRVKAIRNEAGLIDLLRHDFHTEYAVNFMEYSDLPLETWAKILPVSKRTLQRQLAAKKGKLGLEVAEPLLEVGEIYRVGLQAFDDRKERLIQWLKTENPYFNGKPPLGIMDSHTGRELVREELLRIEYGVFA